MRHIHVTIGNSLTPPPSYPKQENTKSMRMTRVYQFIPQMREIPMLIKTLYSNHFVIQESGKQLNDVSSGETPIPDGGRKREIQENITYLYVKEGMYTSYLGRLSYSHRTEGGRCCRDRRSTESPSVSGKAFVPGLEFQGRSPGNTNATSRPRAKKTLGRKIYIVSLCTVLLCLLSREKHHLFTASHFFFPSSTHPRLLTLYCITELDIKYEEKILYRR